MHSKENHKQKEKITHRKRKIFANEVTDEGLISKNIKTAHALQYTNKQTNKPSQKMGKRSE